MANTPTKNGPQVDLEAVGEVLRRADVITIGFTAFPERLLVDTRSNESAGPMAAVVEPVASVQGAVPLAGQEQAIVRHAGGILVLRLAANRPGTG